LTQDEKYSIFDLYWVRKAGQYAVCIYTFGWQGMVNGKPVGGSGRGTSMIVKENGKWSLLTEHLGPITT